MKKLDHKELGRRLGFFSFSRIVPGTCFWWPKGAMLFHLIVEDLEKHLQKQGYQELKTPTVISLELLKKSGHYDNYREKIFLVSTARRLNWCLKPMNCPGSLCIFKEEMRSYRDLPLRFSEIGTVYRYEQPGEVNGLLRTRALTIDDAHIYCREEDIKPELIKLIDFTYETYQRYGFKKVTVELSTRPEKSIGTDTQWEKAEEGLKEALKEKGIRYQLNKGEGAFYGPKIDFHTQDSLGRSWQMGTIQLDFAMAERLGAHYIDEKGQKQSPVMIHRAILGSIERFIAILLEHTQGALPFWLSPVQIVILPISEKHRPYAEKVGETLKENGLRVEVEVKDETLEKKIRLAELQRVPYILVVGEREVKSGKVAIRQREKGDLGPMKLEDFVKKVKREASHS